MKLFTLQIALGLLFISIHAQNVLVVDQAGGGQYITINSALTAAVAGDTIKVMPGLYYEQIGLSKKIHFLAMDTTVILDFQTAGTFFFNAGSNGSSLQGFKIRKPVSAASGVKDILIAANIFDSTTITLNLGAGSAVFMNNLLRNSSLTATNSAEKILIFNNRFISTLTSGNLLSISGGNIIVSQNYFKGASTAISTGSNTSILGNKINDCFATGIYFNSSHYIKIIGNEIKNATQRGIHGQFNSSGTQSFSNILISNNLIINSTGSAGIQFDGNPNAHIKTMNSQIKNNVIVNSIRGFYISGLWTGSTLFEIKNNIFAFNTNEAVTTNYGIMNTDYNCTFSNGNNNLSGTGNLLNINPAFVNSEAGNFNLQSNSACKDAGSPVVSDFDLDKTRNDMGIYGGSFNWNNFNSTNSSRVVELFLTPQSISQGSTITITGSGVGNKTQNTQNKNLIIENDNR